ncbi:hypothetical protein [Microbispora rosea]
MKRPNPGRLPPAEQRAAAERKLAQEARDYFKARRELDKHLHAAIVAAAQPPVDVPASEQKSLVTRADIVRITKEADPEAEGLSLRAVQKIIHDAEQTAIP